MTVLILGLLIFLTVHSVRIIAEPWRAAQIARVGPNGWKGLYSLASIVGLVLIAWGFGLARGQPVVLWTPPMWGRHVTALFTVLAFVLVAAAYVPGNRIKAVLGHPMVAGVQIWALGHLFANGTLAAVVLFGAFLAWAVADFASARRRDRLAGTRYQAGTLARDAAVVVIGLASWALVAFMLHGWLAGVPALI
ncbi:NnrU family protein [Cupriavidus sp. IDO]|uniref:NnrU family protein n=1 Tax=Cupriavidus sp. IDO TaxID=1539142 RepID=UPI0005797205|nr:NnrU family protein [Cupriavidus sp. IDO]KWR87746.1 NnrU family protein [Cupriavidus sp. IDO]